MNNEEKEIDLRDIFSLFLSKLWMIIFAAVIGGVVAFCYSKFVLPLKYSSHISVCTFRATPVFPRMQIQLQ